MADNNTYINTDEGKTDAPHAEHSYAEERFFEIRVKGQLDSHWAEWLEGLEVRLLENGEMILCGPIADQAALLGVLNKLSSLNLSLLALNEIKKKD